MHDAVVLLAHNGAGGTWDFSCSATLIAPNLLVTARHCLSVLADDNVACDGEGNQVVGSAIGADRNPSDFSVYVGPARPVQGTTKVSAIGKTIFHDTATTLCGHDLAFLLLDRSLDKTTILPVRLGGAPAVGESIVAVGYGQLRDGTDPPVRQERANIPVRYVGPFLGNDVDPAVAPGDFMTGESFCQGDSGGPALAQSSDAVVGVATRVANDRTQARGTRICTDSSIAKVFAFYTQMSTSADVAKKAFAAAGYAPWLEGQHPPWWVYSDGCSVESADRFVQGADPGRNRWALFAGALLVALLGRRGRRFFRELRRSRGQSHRDRIPPF